MKPLYSVAEVAAEFEVSDQTVRNWIEAGQLVAFQAVPGGHYKVPAQSLVVFKQNAGMLPKEGLRVPDLGPTKVFASLEEFYQSEIEPVLSSAGARNVPEFLEMAEADPALAQVARELLPAYGYYLQERAASRELVGAY